MESEVAELLRTLEQSHDRGEWTTARELSERILAVDPDNADAQVYIRIAIRKIDSTEIVDVDRDAQDPNATVARNEKKIPILGSDAFVGREQEVELLKTAFEEAATGHGRLVMLVGEPGIGKTRTAEELSAYADSR